MRRRLVLGAVPMVLSALAAYALVQRGQASLREVTRLVEVLEITAGSVVADVGAGDGRWSVALASHVGELGRVYATEVDPDDLKLIRERVEREGVANVSVIEGSQVDTGLPSGCCDAVFLRRVYHHFEEPDAMRASLRRSLREGGLLLVTEFEPARRRGGHGAVEEDVVEELEGAGFTLVEELDWPNGDYALLFRASESASPG